ncbi:4Fe-4S single cluster domain-containing protein [Streptomyces sp. NPDC089919]|uniref:4Fe-4S single cluster domain-containing protein n=1 Tax=Streptomyces sp. NPDC089919 TaxID=3155188 RepID=UPI003435B3AC
MRIRIGGTHFPVRTLGPGRRLGVWFQGCPLACPGCMSRHTWAADGGREATLAELLERWREALEQGAEGLTVSGGEPLEQAPALARFLAGADRLRTAADAGRGAGPRPDFLVYTGYDQHEWDPPRLRALRYADAVIAGRFEIAEPAGPVWRGSANQRLLPRTPLGRARYAPHLDRPATGPALQVVVEADGASGGAPSARLLGVPARGELAFYERWLGERGLRLRDRSWRP